MTPLGIGIVGTGQRGMGFFAPYIKNNPHQARLNAVADIDEVRLKSAVEDIERQDLRQYNGVEGLLNDPEVEAVVITTPDGTHREVLEKVLKAGKHAICEKPMATTIEDAIAITKMAMQTNKTVQIGFMLRYAPFFVKLRDLVAAGAIGDLLQVNASEIVEYRHGASYFRRWHRFRAHSGGLLVHKACHTLDVLNWIVDSPPSWVSAVGGTNTFTYKAGAATLCRDCQFKSTCPAAYREGMKNWLYLSRQERRGPDQHRRDECVYNIEKDSVDNAVLNAEYENGVRLAYTFATTGARHERHLLLVGQGGQIHASQADGTISIEPVGGKPEMVVFPEEQRGEHGGGDKPLMESFFNSVATGEKPVADVLAGLYSVSLGVAATQSIDQNGAKVDLRKVFAQVRG